MRGKALDAMVQGERADVPDGFPEASTPKGKSLTSTPINPKFPSKAYAEA